MSALDAIMELNKRRQAERDSQMNAIPNAISSFAVARQQAQQQQNQNLITQITAAKSGFRIENGQLVQDPQLIEQANRSVMGFNPLTGQLEQVGTIRKGDVVRNTTTAEDIQTKEQAKYSGTKETSSRAFDLRKEFQGLETVKDFQIIKNQVGSMDSLLTNLKDEKSRLALDQGLITLFNKITDPQSVVRESEYERTPKNLSLANRFGGAIEKVQKGGAGLTNEDRQALVFGAKVIAKSRGDMYNQTLDNYTKLSEKFGIDPELVTSGYGRYEESSSQSGGKYEFRKLPNGKTQRRLVKNG